ncbi:DUF72 domain-containing protein [Nonomuraea phyllanthi]|uniref:DUF72 domain-containing protein n=1 Tax=Nonomuraea phyllanthi TaxID=2219224 RepID=UPI0037C93F75
MLESGWYPPTATTPEERLDHYAANFPLVEVDATYYHPPALRAAELWRDRTPDDITFNIKAFSLLTQHPTRVRSLDKDLRARLRTAKSKVYRRDVGIEIEEEVWQRFLSALRPLHQAGKLGAILFQFPPWFPARRRGCAFRLRSRQAPASRDARSTHL